MQKRQLYYVVDTNVLVDYVDIIPGDNSVEPESPTVDLTGAHIVIPTAVIRELSSFKGEKSDRGRAARIALRRLRDIAELDVRSMGEAYHLNDYLEVKKGNEKISILPVHKGFERALPFAPSEEDMDGQIILAALTIAFLKAGLPIDGTAMAEDCMKLDTSDVILLTNDNGLAIRARKRGIVTKRYGYKYPEPYTGRRDIIVPNALFCEFLNSRRIDRALFEEMMPQERRLVANEFVVMDIANHDEYPSGFDPADNYYFLNVGRYDRDVDAILPLCHVSSFPVRLKNAGQAIYAESLMNPNFAAVICSGPAGSGKTYMATVYGYNACKSGNFIGVTVVPCESRSKLGALPGDLDEKMDPDVQPIKNALRNYLLDDDSKLKKELEAIRKFGTENKIKKTFCSTDDEVVEKRSIKAKLKDRVDLIWNNWFSSIPIENARGRDFAFEIAIYDEFQDQNAAQADTLIKRIGSDGKIVITGDVEQIHAPYLDQSNNGLVYAKRLLFDNPMVAQVCFTEDEVIRHPLVRMIAVRQKNGFTET